MSPASSGSRVAPASRALSPPSAEADQPRHDEQMVGEAVEIDEGERVERRCRRRGDRRALGAADDGAGEVEPGRAAAAAGQDEAAQRLQALVHRVDLALEPVDLRLDDAQASFRTGRNPRRAWRDRRRDRTIRSGSRSASPRCASSATWRRARPIALLASSTSPIAAKRGSALERREPSTSPVAPASPVRV